MQAQQPPFTPNTPGGGQGWGTNPPGVPIGSGITTAVPTQTAPPPVTIPGEPRQQTLFPQPAMPPVVVGQQQPISNPVVTPAAVHTPSVPAKATAAPATVKAAAPPPTATNGAEPPSILSILREFATRENCERFSADSAKIILLQLYFLCRLLVPKLSFEEFLTRFQLLADYDDTNLKMPADAIAYHLPRSKKEAETRGCEQWAAKEVVGFLTLFVDAIRAAEQQGAPDPCTLLEFLKREDIRQAFRSGAFDEPTVKQPRASRAATKKDAGPTQAIAGALPTVGARVLYTAMTGRQQRGHVTAISAGPSNQLATFVTDVGEQFDDVPLALLSLCSDPVANTTVNAVGDELPLLCHEAITLTPVELQQAKDTLAISTMLAQHEPGGQLAAWTVQDPTHGFGTVAITNAENGPVVDAYWYLPGAQSGDDAIWVLGEPRKNIQGTYTFQLPAGRIVVTVAKQSM